MALMSHIRRTPSYFEAWKKKDPIVSFRKYLEERKILDEAEERRIEERIEREIEEAVEWARTQPSAAPEDLPMNL